MAFIQEKIIVVELNGIDAVFSLEDCENFSGSFRCLCLLPSIENRHHSAELAAKWTTDARMVHGRAAAQKRGQQVAFDRPQLVIRESWKVVRRAQMPLGIVNVQAEVVLEGKT